MVQLSLAVNLNILISSPPVVGDGNIFALPVVATQFTWQSSFVGAPGAISIQILTSLDGVNFALADSSTNIAGEGKTALSSAAFIKARIDTLTIGSCTSVTVGVIAEEGHEPINVGGGGATLPTAPLNQVLISQGAGVDPIFSTNPQVNQLNLLSHLIANGIVVAGAHVRISELPFVSVFQTGVGCLANISDSTVNTIGAIIAGGGTFHVLARWDGTNWICIGGPSALPTAPIGQVLISQGAGVDPVFSGSLAIANQLVVGPASFAGTTFQAKQWYIEDQLIIDRNGGANTLTLRNNSGTIVLGLQTQIVELAFASLATPPLMGTLANISDSTVNTIGSTVAGGGTNHVLARWNGTVWKVIGV